jgi:hypothetical protein
MIAHAGLIARKDFIMALSPHSKQQHMAEPAYRQFHRICLAVCIILAPVLLFLGFAFDPTGGVGVPSSATAVAAEFQAVSPLQVQLFLYFNAVTVYFFPLSFIGLGLLAMRRSPWLATIGIIFGLAGSLPFGVFVGPEALAAGLAQVGVTPSTEALMHSVFSQGAITLLQLSWAVGHLLGYLLLGTALARSKVIPLWAAILIMVAIPFQAAGYITHQGVLQLIYCALLFFGSIPAALAMLKGRDRQEV